MRLLTREAREMRGIRLVGKVAKLGRHLQGTLLPLSAVITLKYPESNKRKSHNLKTCLAGDIADSTINTTVYTNVNETENESEQTHAINTLTIAGTIKGQLIFHVHNSTNHVFNDTKCATCLKSDQSNLPNQYMQNKFEGKLATAGDCEYLIFHTARSTAFTQVTLSKSHLISAS